MRVVPVQKVATEVDNYGIVEQNLCRTITLGGMHEAKVFMHTPKVELQLTNTTTTNYVISEFSAINPAVNYTDLNIVAQYVYSTVSYSLISGATIQNLIGEHNPSLSKGYTTIQMTTATFYESSNIWNISLSDNDFFWNKCRYQ